MSSNRPKVGLVGFGYWGPNLLRNLIASKQFEVAGLADPSDSARAKCANLYGHIPLYETVDQFLAMAKPDGVVIATPPETHFQVAQKCLESGASILVEKPLATTVDDCKKILDLADQKNLKVMVDHTFCYNPPVQFLAKAIHDGGLGDLQFYDSVRVNLGGIQRTNVMWDLAPHDISILDLFTKGRSPTVVSATGMKQVKGTVENVCYLTLKYEPDLIAHFHLNWTAPIKIRQVMVGGTEKMAIYDEMIPAEKVRIYDKKVSFVSKDPDDFRVNYRVGDMVAPALPSKEALLQMVGAFHSYITDGTKPVSDGESGLRMVQILEAASHSLENDGEPVEIRS